MKTDIRKAGHSTTMQVEVRRPFVNDFPAILDICNWATCHTSANFKSEPDTLEHWATLWKGKPETCPWLVAESDKTVVGFAMTSPFQGRCGCTYAVEVSVYVHPDHVGKGVGRALYRQLIPTLSTQGHRTVIAVIATPNPASERLHQSFGFQKVGELARVGWKFGKWHNLAYWQLMLADDDAAPSGCVKNLHEVDNGSTCDCDG